MRGFLAILCFWIGAVSASGATYYVATTGNDSNPGTIGSPWLTVAHSFTVAGHGDTVLIRAGTYRENIVNPGQPGGGSVNNMLHIASYPGEQVFISGLVQISGGSWSSVSTPVIVTATYPATSPNNTITDDTTSGNTGGTVWSASRAGRAQQAFYVSNAGPNEVRIPLQQLGWSSTDPDWVWQGNPGSYTKVDLRPSILTTWQDWSFWYLPGTTTLYVRLATGFSPSAGTIEVSSTIPFQLDWDFVEVSGITFLGSQTTDGSLGQPAVALHTNGFIHDCTVEWTDAGGMYCQDHGTISNCTAKGCGLVGVNASGPINLLSCNVLSNDWRHFAHNAEGGAKIISAYAAPSIPDFGGSVIQGNTFTGNGGPGLWFDTCISNLSDVLVLQNTFSYNVIAGILVEGSGNTVANFKIYNNLMLSNGLFGGVYGYGSRNCQIQFNTARSGLGSSCMSWQDIGVRPVNSGNAIANNIFVQDDPTHEAINVQIGFTSGDGFHDLRKSNSQDRNCYAYPGVFACVAQDDANLTNNCGLTLGQYTAYVAPYWDANSVIGDPVLDARYTPSNPGVINKGIPVFPVTTDFYGLGRNVAPTFGAVEVNPVRNCHL